MDMITCNGLGKAFGSGRRRCVALADVGFTVARGEAVAVVGRNGAGKSTLLKILSTVVTPDSGAASVAGHDVVHDPSGARAAIGCSGGDERSFYWRLTGRQNLELFAALHDIPKADIRESVAAALETAGISAKADVRFNAYSSGMRQRLSLARAMLHGPDVLLLDEPNRGLDPVHTEKFNAFLKDKIADGMGKTLLFSTHDLGGATAIADRALVLERGRIVYFGPVEGASGLRDILLTAADGGDDV